jgi:hypothetical protein
LAYDARMRLLWLVPLAALAAEPVVVRPRDNGAALVNPGMGWVAHHYDNQLGKYHEKLAPSDTIDEFPGLSVVYLRLAWSYIEPEEGKFEWSIVDTPAQRWIAKGKQVAFRITCSESDRRQPYATPQWVRQAGAKGYFFQPGKGIVDNGPNWEPDFDDPVFLAKLDAFLAAAARRYDGNPEVAFLDVGSLGVWGEGHTIASTKLNYSAATVKRHVDLHTKNFKRTLLAANDDWAMQGRGPEALEYAFSQGLTLRDDSILVEGAGKEYKSAQWAERVWRDRPVILESEHYGMSRDRGVWVDGSKYLEAIERYHASYASIHWEPHEFLASNRALIEKINLRLGYRLVLTEAAWDGGQFRYKLRNAGVAPCLPGGYISFTLKDSQGGIAVLFADDSFDVRNLAPDGDEVLRSFPMTVPSILKAGTYSVYFSIGTRTGTPVIALPLEAGDGQRRYRLGEIRIAAR